LKTLRSALLWAIGGLYFFCLFVMVSAGLVFFSGKTIYPMVKLLMHLQLLVVGVPLRVTGLEKFDRCKPYVIVGNHQSLFDAFAIPAALPMHAVAIEASYHFSMPLWGYLARKWGNIPAHRGDRRKAVGSLLRARKVIQSGTSIIILPEGSRTLTGNIGEFKKGPFHLAMAAKADILPFAINGLFQYKRKGSWLLNPGCAHFRFGSPVEYEAYKDRSVEEVMNDVRTVVEGLLRELEEAA